MRPVKYLIKEGYFESMTMSLKSNLSLNIQLNSNTMMG